MKRCLICLALGTICGATGGIWLDRTIRGYLATLPLPSPIKTELLKIYQ